MMLNIRKCYYYDKNSLPSKIAPINTFPTFDLRPFWQSKREDKRRPAGVDWERQTLTGRQWSWEKRWECNGPVAICSEKKSSPLGRVRHSLLVAEEKRSQRSAQAGARSKVIGIAVSADVLLPQYLLPLSDNSKKNGYWLPLLYFPIFYSLSEMSGTIDMKRLPQSQRKKEKDRSSKLKKQAVCLRASLVKDNSPSKPRDIYVVSSFLSQNFVIR